MAAPSPTSPPPGPTAARVFAAIPPAVRELGVLGLLAVSAVLSLVVAPDRAVTPGTIALAMLPLAALPWRRHAPLAVFAITEVLAIATRVTFGPNGPSDLVVLVALYGVATRRRARWAVVAVALDATLLVLTGIVSEAVPPDQLRNEALGQVALGLVVALYGMYVAARRSHLQAVEDRAERLARTAELEARAAVDEERRRIARELHDVVAHHVSVMTLHAGALERQLGAAHADDELVAAASGVRTTGQEAMRELRHLLDVLHRDPDATGTAPPPTLHDLDALVERMRGVGMPVSLTTAGPLDAVPSGMALSVHRIAQEALTNTLRHAGPVATEVRLAVSTNGVRLDVRDHGTSATPPTYAREAGSGHGLAGMRERAALYGGEVSAGPHPDGGFEVTVTLPLDATAAEGDRQQRPAGT